MNVVEELDKILEDIRVESDAALKHGLESTEHDAAIALGKIRGLNFAAERIRTLANKLSAPTTGAE